MNEDVQPGDKSNCFLLVNNQRNMRRLAPGNNKKCDFYDECGTWDHSKGNTYKTIYVVTGGSLHHVELKNNFYSTKVRRQGKSIGFHYIHSQRMKMWYRAHTFACDKPS